MVSWCKKGEDNAEISKWANTDKTTNVSMTLCAWQMCHPTMSYAAALHLECMQSSLFEPGCPVLVVCMCRAQATPVSKLQ